MTFYNTLVRDISGRSRRNFAHVTMVILLWPVQNFAVVVRAQFKPKHCKFWSNFEFDRNTGGRLVFSNITHYHDAIMGAIASQITSLTIVYSIVYSDVDQRKHQSFASLAFVWGIHRWPVNSPHKWPVTRKRFPFDDVIMNQDWDMHNSIHETLGRAGTIYRDVIYNCAESNTAVSKSTNTHIFAR